MTFSYNDYQKAVAAAQENAGENGIKIGFFKLAEDGEEALVRFNVSSMDDLQFASVHQLSAAQKWMKVGCINPFGNGAHTCPFCREVANGNSAIGKASKKVFIQLLVSYKDPSTGEFCPTIPVIWERPAAFSKDLANFVKDYGDLRESVFKITRNGKKGDMQTTYSISFIPIYNKPEYVPKAGFAAFTNFNIARHSYWDKTVDEMETFIATGTFPEAAKASTASSTVSTVASAAPSPATVVTSVATTPVINNPTPVAANSSDLPQRTFSSFSF